jgi:hypothetical protein
MILDRGFFRDNPLPRACAGLTLAAALVACAPPAPPAGVPGAVASPPVPALGAGFSPSLAPPFQAASARADTLRPGVVHTAYTMPHGPWSVHLVELDPRACGAEWRAAKAMDRVVGRETTSSIVQRVGTAEGRPVLAAVNADFFLFDPPGVPVGPHVQAGRVFSSAMERSVFGITAAGEPRFGRTAIRGRFGAPAAGEHPIHHVNRPPPAQGITLYDGAIGVTTPVDTGVVELRVAPVPGLGWRLGERGRGVVLDVDTLPRGVPPGDGVVLAARGAAAGTLRALQPGDSVTWALASSDGEEYRELVGAFPHLLRGGEYVAEVPETLRERFGAARHPRTAVARRPDGTLLLLLVDGRQPETSVGMSLLELADLLLALGATDAVNLDGGGSSAMIVGGSLVNRPSDATGERAVANALLLLGPRPGECPHP